MGVTEYGRGHQFAHHGLLVSWHVQKLRFVLIRLARPRILQGPENVFLLRDGTNDYEQPRSVPFVPMLFG